MKLISLALRQLSDAAQMDSDIRPPDAHGHRDAKQMQAGSQDTSKIEAVFRPAGRGVSQAETVFLPLDQFQLDARQTQQGMKLSIFSKLLYVISFLFACGLYHRMILPIILPRPE